MPLRNRAGAFFMPERQEKMAICPFAVKRLIPKWNKVKITRYRRMNVHVAVSERESLHEIFSLSGNACSHFYVTKAGVIEQYIDTAYRSVSDLNGNDSTISAETQGGMGNSAAINAEEFTSAQFLALVRLWAWVRDTHGIKNQVAKNTQTNDNSAGLSWHRLGVKGNFAGRKGIAATSYASGGILYSGAAGKECPGDAKILQIPKIFAAANGKTWQQLGTIAPAGNVKPAAPKPPKPAPAKTPKGELSAAEVAKLDTGAWPSKALPVKGEHTTQSHNAWVKLMFEVGYADKKLGLALQNWLADSVDPRTKRGYYDTKKFLLDGNFGKESVKALQRFLYDREDDNGKRLYDGYADGDRGALTVRAEFAYLNTKANRGV